MKEKEDFQNILRNSDYFHKELNTLYEENTKLKTEIKTCHQVNLIMNTIKVIDK